MGGYDHDRLLHIKTGGDQSGADPSSHYYRYEATPYHALHTLFQHYELNRNDRVVDFGCGKGRLAFYVHYQFKAAVIGVEMNERFCRDAEKNEINYRKKNPVGKGKIQFYCGLAETYPIHPEDNCFYFFNPFSIQIFMKVIRNLLVSYETTARPLDLLLYYPSEDYISFLEDKTPFERKDNIVLKDRLKNNRYERFLIYRLE